MSEQGQEQQEQQEKQEQQEQKQEKKRKGGLIVVIVAIIIIILLGIIVYLLWPHEKERRNVLVTPENVESVLEEAQETEKTGYYTVTMNPIWHFETGEAASYDAIVANVVENTNDVYFDVVLESDESQVLYSSPVIPRGGQLGDIELDETLEMGTYNCVVIYHLIDDEQNTLSTLRVTLDIVVEG